VLEKRLRTPVAVSAAPEPPTVPSSASTPWTQMAPILAAVAGGIGVIGFVTFVGGAVVWARLQGVGFPAAPALGVIPTQDLVVIGAETMVPLILVAIGVVVALVLLYSLIRYVVKRVHEGASARLQTFEAAATGEQAVGVAIFLFVFVVLFAVVVQLRDQLRPGWFVIGFVLAVAFGLVGALAAEHLNRFADVAIAGRKPVADALRQADELAKELCELEPQAPPSDKPENCRTAPAGHEQP
jgi:predicted outer membrane lipoprotein